MKKLLFGSLFAACAAVSLSSCMNGDYDANPVTVNGANNPLNNGTNGTNGTNGSFVTSGTDPLSAKINGTGFVATTATFGTITYNGVPFEGITAHGSGSEQLTVAFPTNAVIGTVYATSGSTGGMDYIVPDGSTVYSALNGGTGSVKLLENDATHVKGVFFGNIKGLLGIGSVAISEGYFNVTK